MLNRTICSTFHSSVFFPTGMADCILVNSNFTAQTFFKTFTSLTDAKPLVLYPSLNFKAYDAKIELEDNVKELPQTAEFVFLSINRFERKKNLQLALKALGNLKSKISTEEWKRTHLIMAGTECSWDIIYHIFRNLSLTVCLY